MSALSGHAVVLADNETSFDRDVPPVEHHPVENTDQVFSGLEKDQPTSEASAPVKSNGVRDIDVMHDLSFLRE